MKFIWGSSRIFIIEEIQPKRIQRAVDIVESAIQGKIGFCFKSVPKVPLHSGFEANNWIERRNKALMDSSISELEIYRIREDIKHLKTIVKSHILWDETTERKLKSNFTKLQKALILLSKEGIIGSYTLMATGKLNVNWFNEWQKPVLIEIRQGFTYTYDELAIKTESMIQEEYEMDQAFCGRIIESIELKGTGTIHKPYVGNINRSSGELNPRVLQHRGQQDVQIPELKEVSKLLEGLEPKDMVRVIAYLMYLKERWRKRSL